MDEREQMKAWVEKWKAVDAMQRKLRAERIRESSLEGSIRSFDDAFRSAIWLEPAGATSGLVEFQRILAKSK